MKTSNDISILLCCLLFGTPLWAGPDSVGSIFKSSLACGGGISRSDDGRFVLNGTVGQPWAAPRLRSQNAPYDLEPGFWHGVVVVPAPGGPWLTIRSGVSGWVILAWPKEVQGYVLETTSRLESPDWKPVLLRVVDTDTEHTVTLPRGTRGYFRLREIQ